MKPRTLIEKEASKINAKIKEDISICDKNWIVEYSDYSYYCSGGNKKETVVYFTLTENRKDWTIDRLYRIYRYNNKKSPVYLIMEVGRIFVKDDKILYFTKQRFVMNSWVPYDTFSYSSNIELRKNDLNSYGYSISGVFSLSEYERRRHGGKRVKCIHDKPKGLNKVLKFSYGETLYNQGENMLIDKLIYNSHTKELLSSIRIAKKHGFVFNKDNVHKWFDMVNSMIYLHKDNHNPKYVAPDNLDYTHNLFVGKVSRKKEGDRRILMELTRIKAEKEQLIKLNKEIKENEEYIKRRRRFYDMVISDGNFFISVLKDINEFFEEGKCMSHCVFSCEYYKKKESLILSARNAKGERIETIEVDLKKFKVIQCYGYKDVFTSHHQKILDLTKRNMNKIRMFNAGKGKVQLQLQKVI